MLSGKLLLGALGVVATVLCLKDSKTVTEEKGGTVDDTVPAPNAAETEGLSFEEEMALHCADEINQPESISIELPHPAHLRRGDRFTCPETGEVLQVRAIGGRPMHKSA